jgi:hypothetical protein
MTPLRGWPRLIAEGAAILASILLAFGLQAWWEGRNERLEEQQLLSAIRTEWQANLRVITDQVARVADIRGVALALMSEGAAPGSTVSTDSLDTLIGGASWWSQSQFEMAAIDAVTTGDQFSLVRSDELRRLITSWKRDAGTFERLAAQDYDFFVDAWMPFLTERAYMPQVANALSAVPGGGGEILTQHFPVFPTQMDHGPLVHSPQFQGLLLQKVWIQDDLLLSYENLRVSLQDMLDVLDSKIN